MNGRLEKRTTMVLPVLVASALAPGDADGGTTENVSPGGARVIVPRQLQRGELVLVTLRTGATPAQARVIYCQALPGGFFGVGLAFPEPPWSWIGRGPSD